MNVRTGSLDSWAIRPTTIVESIPPDSSAPRGTSLTSLRLTALVTVVRTSSSHSSSASSARVGLELPEPLRPDLAVLPDEDVPRGKPANPRNAGLDAGDVLEREVRVERARIQLTPQARQEQQRLQLGCERERAVRQRDVVQRLLPDPVAGEDETLARAVPERDGEHPAERGRKADAVLLVRVRDDCGVAGSRHRVAPLREVTPDLVEAVQLAVEDRDDVAGLVRRRLISRLEVDDPEPAMAENAPAERGDATRVGPPVDERRGHACDDIRVGRSGGRY